MNRQYVLVFLGSIFWFACSDNKVENKEVEKLPPQYYYYPKANVYFDSANKEYLFQSSNSSTWQSARQIPAVVQALMDTGAYIPSPADPVWKDNENHRLVYSASLYAIPGDTVENKPVLPTGKKPAHTPSDSSEKNKKERKGLRRFFDKIFGGGKKEQENL